MKKFLLFVFSFVSFIGFSQNINQKIQNYLNDNKYKFNLTTQDVSDWVVESTANSDVTKIDNYFIKQRYQEIEIFQTNSNVWVKNGEVINMHNAFINNISQKVNTINPSKNVLEALSYARNFVHDYGVNSEIIANNSNKEYILSNGNLLEDPARAKLVFHLTNNNELRLAWDVNFYTQDYKHLWSMRVDAVNGDILEKHDMVISCNFGNSNHKDHNHNFFFTKQGFKNTQQTLLNVQSGSYNVYPYYIESPNHGTRQLIVSPHNTTASPYGWHDTNGAAGNEFTYTRGNNVWAQEDADGNNGTGASPNGGASLVFDYPYGGTGVAATTYTDAATTNLFYMNNIMHDVWYQYGFNEVNGNFQQNNYGKGGTTSFTGDAVFADAQDGSGTNNANFSAPADGQRGRMQMYLWDVGPRPKYLIINSPASIAGEYVAANNVFSPGNVALPNAPGLTTDFVLFDDGSPDNTDACSAAVNAAAINGKIVIIRRGICTFVEKVIAAQTAGAVAVIIVNNDAANPNTLVNMSGADATITIPAIFVTYNVGEAIIAAMNEGTVNGTIKNDVVTFVNSDGDFDNVVIAHEFGHGISIRLAGGPANSSCLNNAEQMGEGWSDFFGLMMQMKAGDNPEASRGIGTFVFSEPIDGVGIRTYPYSTSFSLNPHTFADTNTEVVPHGVGSVWAAMLWDLAWAYVGKYGFDSNIYTGTGGNNKVMRLVLDAIKLQPCSPTFVQGRDAIIAADQATTGGQDFCLIWEVFARRGLGVAASSGSGTSTTDQIEDFTEPAPGPNCTLGLNYIDSEDFIKVYPNPSNGELNISITNFTGKLSIQLVDVNGRTVYQENVNNFNLQKTLQLQGLQSGMYILKLEADNVSHSKKIILN